MSSIEVTHDDLWFCADCTIVCVNGDVTGIDDDERIAEVEAGLAEWSQHGHLVPDFGDDEEGYDEFSWRGCECCGSRLGGSRHRFAVLCDVRSLLRRAKSDGDWLDAWGETMGWLFAIAGELYHRCDGPPDEWRYSPGAGGDGRDPDDYRTEVVAAYPTPALDYAGAVLFRYSERLEAAGRAY